MDHVADMSKPKDLLKILTLGMISDVSGLLYHLRYQNRDKFVEEILQERLCFCVLWKIFTIKYTTYIRELWVHPTYIYKVAMVAFAMLLIQYYTTINNVKDAVTMVQLKQATEKHFNKDNPDLVHVLDGLLEKGSKGWLLWNGPAITIVRHAEAEVQMAVGCENLGNIPKTPYISALVLLFPSLILVFCYHMCSSLFEWMSEEIFPAVSEGWKSSLLVLHRPRCIHFFDTITGVIFPAVTDGWKTSHDVVDLSVLNIYLTVKGLFLATFLS